MGKGVDLAGHECVWREVEIEDAEGDEILRSGMKVLIPCSCGETALDHLTALTRERDEADKALLDIEPRRTLYHWAPTARRKQILRYGLRPSMRATTNSGKYPVICLGDSPSWAWALSGGMKHVPAGHFDLWETTLDCLQDPIVLANPDRSSGIHEIRTRHRIYKRHLWLAAGRVKEPVNLP